MYWRIGSNIYRIKKVNVTWNKFSLLLSYFIEHSSLDPCKIIYVLLMRNVSYNGFLQVDVQNCIKQMKI